MSSTDRRNGGSKLKSLNRSSMTCAQRCESPKADRFQSFNLIGDLTVFENVELPLTYRGMATSERRERVNLALKRWACRTAPNTFPHNCRVANNSELP